jgi:hypothetical protein
MTTNEVQASEENNAFELQDVYSSMIFDVIAKKQVLDIDKSSFVSSYSPRFDATPYLEDIGSPGDFDFMEGMEESRVSFQSLNDRARESERMYSESSTNKQTGVFDLEFG